MKKQVKKLVLAKETIQVLDASRVVIAGGSGNTRSVYWSCVCTPSGMYTCQCPTQEQQIGA